MWRPGRCCRRCPVFAGGRAARRRGALDCGTQDREVAEHLDDEYPGCLGLGGDVPETHVENTSAASPPTPTGGWTLQQARNLAISDAICERLVGTLRREAFDRTLILGEAHVRAVARGIERHKIGPAAPVAARRRPGTR